ncbi:hypothetical protein BaRGS_00039509, partial [Batillaria attramentaria]
RQTETAWRGKSLGSISHRLRVTASDYIAEKSLPGRAGTLNVKCHDPLAIASKDLVQRTVIALCVASMFLVGGPPGTITLVSSAREHGVTFRVQAPTASESKWSSLLIDPGENHAVW